MRAVQWVAAGVFLIAAFLQFNDPDPFVWITLYVAAAAAALLSLSVAPRWLWPSAVGVVAFSWAAILAPRVLPALELRNLARSMSAESPEIEQGREILGLLIVALWMLISVVSSSRAGRSAAGNR